MTGNMFPGSARWFVGGLLTVAIASGGACGRQAESPLPADARATGAHELPAAAGAIDQGSIFDLDLALVDQEGRQLRLADLRGTVMLAAMVYTSCDSVCIMVTEQMKAIERQLAGVDDHVRYTLFSLDPGRDTPEAMRAFARTQQLDTARWRLLAASEDDVRTLAAVLGVRYQLEENGEIAHSAMIFVIDGEGVVRHRQVGVGPDGGALVAAVRRARD